MSIPDDTFAGPAPARPDIEVVRLIAGGQDFGIEVAQVREIRRWTQVTSIPHAPDCLLGVLNLRGTVIPIFDLALRLGLGETQITPRHVTMIVSAGERSAGLLVDMVTELLTLPADGLQRAPLMSGNASFLKGMAGHDGGTLRILNVEALAPKLAEPAS